MANILISEDDPDVRRILTHLLVDAGHEVSSARDGEAALEMLLAQPPDMLLLDLMLPGMDGYDLLEQMQEHGLHQKVKVLVLTARGSEQDWQRSFELGAARYVTKPFDPDELLRMVDDLLAQSHEQLAAERERQRDRAKLLSQLETLFDGPT